MNADEYQEIAVSTEIYTEAAERFAALSSVQQTLWLQLAYCTGKLNGEAGELAELVFKAFRGDVSHIPEIHNSLVKELGDIQWYVANIAHILGVDLSAVMAENMLKLKDRKRRGVIHGYGDDR